MLLTRPTFGWQSLTITFDFHDVTFGVLDAVDLSSDQRKAVALVVRMIVNKPFFVLYLLVG